MTPQNRRRLRFVYLAPVDIQVARVDRQSIVYLCSALARRGIPVELVGLGIELSPAETHRADHPLDLYGVRDRFPVEIVRTHLNQGSPSWAVGLTRLHVHVRAALKRVRHQQPDELLVFYLKNYAPAFALLIARRVLSHFVVAFEAHVPPRNRFQNFLIRRVDAVITDSYALADELQASGLIKEGRVIGIHQGVDLEMFSGTADKMQFRASLDLPPDRPLAIYTGKIFRGYEEIEYILQAASVEVVRHVLFVLVGGRGDHVASLRKEATRRGLENVLFTGFVPPREVHLYQRAADLLLLYYPTSVRASPYLSPGKLFEYMASGVPIVAADLPVLRETLGDPPACIVVPPDSPADLAAAISRVLANAPAAKARAADARQRVRAFTWDERARRILEFLREAAL